MSPKDNVLPKVYVNSVPKSGTHLLSQILQGIPGMKDVVTWYFLENFDTIKDLPHGLLGLGHFPYKPEVLKKIRKNGIKPIFLSRDPRDIAVSLAHFFAWEKVKDHPLHEHFTKQLKTQDERLLAIIRGVDKKYPGVYQHTKQIYTWRKAPNVLQIRYEDLIRDHRTRNIAVRHMINYLWDDLKKLDMTKQELANRMIQNINPGKSWTYRKGKVGGWREEFKEHHKAEFKKVTGNWLVELGYEKNQNW
jgi:hypothetical protein